jgi:predicted anti-sigma-YlaC factor YlaD
MSMECHETPQIEAYHDGELSPIERVRIETHLRECEACRRVLEQLQRLSSLVADSPVAAMPPEAMGRLAGAWDLVRARSLGERLVQERAANERGVLRIAGWLTAAAAALLMGGLVMLSPSKQRTTVGEVATGSGGTVTFASGAWDTAAVMPPDAVQEGTPELVQVAQWIADDLANTADASRGNR